MLLNCSQHKHPSHVTDMQTVSHPDLQLATLNLLQLRVLSCCKSAQSISSITIDARRDTKEMMVNCRECIKAHLPSHFLRVSPFSAGALRSAARGSVMLLVNRGPLGGFGTAGV